MRHLLKSGLLAMFWPSDTRSESTPSVYSWGNNTSGQLGLGSEISKALPCQIQDLKRERVQNLFASGQCSSSSAITDLGEILTWGNGLDNILGHNAGDSNVLIPTRLNIEKSFKKIALGGGHMLGITTEGSIWSWGLDDCGQCGQEILKQVVNPREFRPQLLRGREPGPVVGIDEKVKDVACGKYFSVALTEAGEVYTWGVGREYALGHGNRDSLKTPTKVKALQDVKITQIAAGRNFVIALDGLGNVYSWGSNDYGQLGLGQNERFKSSPEKLRLLHDIVQLSCGDFHVLALNKNGEVYSWGQGTDGQLGLGTTSNQATPSLIKSLGKVSRVECGGGHSAFITSEFKLMMCGRGTDGQLGRQGKIESIASNRNSPVEVEHFSGSRVLQVAGGAHHSLALVIEK